MKILQEACSPEAALDKTLPYNAYLVEYKVDGNIQFDITTSSKQVEMFDLLLKHIRQYLFGNYIFSLEKCQRSVFKVVKQTKRLSDAQDVLNKENGLISSRVNQLENKINQ